jgi:ankyrin repeat protein
MRKFILPLIFVVCTAFSMQRRDRLFSSCEVERMAKRKKITHESERERFQQKLNENLIEAVVFNEIEKVQYFLEQGADVNTQGKNGFFVLHYALNRPLQREALILVDLILQYKPDVNCRESVDGKTPLIDAAQNGFVGVIEKLLQAGADPNSVDHYQLTPLHCALGLKDDEKRSILIALLQKFGARGDTKDKSFIKQALKGSDRQAKLNEDFLTAASYGEILAMKTVLGEGADIDAQDKQVFSSLHCAMELELESDRLAMIQFLLHYQPNLDLKNDEGITPLGMAVHKGCISTAKALLKAGADPNVKDNFQELCLHHALSFEKNKRFEFVRLLSEYGVNFETPDRDGVTPVVLSIADGDVKCVNYLLDMHVCVDNISIAQNVLHVAAINGLVSVIDLLIPKLSGNYIDAVDWAGDTPLHKAVMHGHKKAVEKLLENKPNPFFENKSKKIASEIAREKGYKDIAQLINTYEYAYLVRHQHSVSQFKTLQ